MEEKIKIKTYAVEGFMEYMCDVATGWPHKPYISIHFTGGQQTGYGVTPARFTTQSPVLQGLIEKSTPFLRKKITLYKEVEIPSDKSRTQKGKK